MRTLILVVTLVAVAFAAEKQPAKRGVLGEYGAGVGYLGSGVGLASPLGYGLGATGLIGGVPVTQTVSQINQHVGVVAPYPVPVTVQRAVPVAVAKPYPVSVPAPYPVAIPQPVAVPVARPVPVSVPRAVAYPVAQPVAIPVPRPIGVAIPQPVGVPVPQAVPVSIPQPYGVPVPQPIIAPQPVAVGAISAPYGLSSYGLGYGSLGAYKSLGALGGYGSLGAYKSLGYGVNAW